MSYPFIKKELPAESTNLFDNDINISQSDKPNEPLISNGFNSETNSIKNKLDNEDYQQKLKNSPKWKYINNPFEHNISVKYKDFTDITTVIIKKYKIKNKIISRSFFKMWEILKQYDLIDSTNKQFNSFHMAEAPGGFVQATILYNDLVYNSTNNSTFFGISLDNEIKFNNQLNKEYGTGKNRRFFQFKTNKTMNGDLTDLSVIAFLQKSLNKNEPNLITADGGFDPLHENYHEQESYVLILSEIFTAISLQKKGGHFVCKFLDMYTDVTIKLLYIISIFYNKVELYKPFSSRQSNTERYVIAKDFKYNKTDKTYKDNYKILKELFISCKKVSENNSNIISIFPEFKIPSVYRSIVANFNIDLACIQYINLFNRFQYFKSSNLNNHLFIKYSKEQENATNFWIETFIE